MCIGTPGVGMGLVCRWNVVRAVQEGGMTRFAAEDAIAARLMDAAEIVFTTLSSTGRRAFAHTRRFDLVLIDEACQASEMATLQPLTLASGKCALLGFLDPLPCPFLWPTIPLSTPVPGFRYEARFRCPSHKSNMHFAVLCEGEEYAGG